MHATRAAVQEGIVPGGGVALLRAATSGSLDNLAVENEDEQTGIKILRLALESPLRTIVANAGGEPSVVVQRVKEGTDSFGYNARTDVFEDLYKAGIIDPTKVTRLALENAASIASLLLTTACVVADDPEDEKPAPMPQMGGGMGGMM